MDAPGLIALALGAIWVWIVVGRKLFNDWPPVSHRIIREMSDGVLVLDGSDRVLDANPASGQLLGVSQDRLIGARADRSGELSPLLRGAEQSPVSDNRYDCSPYPGCTLDVRKSPIRDSDGSSVGQLYVFRNVSADRRLQDELQAANVELEKQIEQIAALQAKLREGAVRDPLTGLMNRRFFEEFLEREISRCHRDGIPLSLVVIDLDFLKQVNDRFGHPVGDLVLRQVGDALRERTRREEQACRTGGDEFVIVLPQADRTCAGERAVEWLRAIHQVSIPGLQDLRLTATAGVATLSPLDDSRVSLLRSADEALYEAKRRGRNRVCIARARRTDASIETVTRNVRVVEP